MESGRKQPSNRPTDPGRSSRGGLPCRRARTSALLALLFMLLLVAAAGCGGTADPAGKVVERFFNAVHDEDPAAVRALLEKEARADFEVAMSDAELADHLADANAALVAQYGADWRKKLRVLSVQKGDDAGNGASWSVTVSLGTTEGDRQVVPVLERDGSFWLDLSWIASGE